MKSAVQAFGAACEGWVVGLGLALFTLVAGCEVPGVMPWDRGAVHQAPSLATVLAQVKAATGFDPAHWLGPPGLPETSLVPESQDPDQP